MAILQVSGVLGAAALVAQAFLMLLTGSALYWLYRGVQVRSMVPKLKKQGIPVMPHHPVFGHLITIQKLLEGVPSDAHGNYMTWEIQKQWRTLFSEWPSLTRCPPVVYVDVWPFAAPFLLSLDPDVSAQFTQTVSLVKAPQQKAFLVPLTGAQDLAAYEGAEWRVWRRRLNPGFSPQQIVARVPELVEEVEVFTQKLRSKAGPKKGEWGRVFPLQDDTILLSLDVIGRFVLGRRLNEQSGELTPLSRGLLTLLPLLRFYNNIANIRELLNPWYHWKLWYNKHIMRTFLRPIIQSSLDAMLSSTPITGDMDSKAGISSTGRTVLDLSIRSLAEEKAEELARNKSSATVDPRSLVAESDFIAHTTGNVNTFLFAGHDTTATTICWAFHLLELNPHVLARLRAELDDVFGADDRSADAVAAQLRANPALINALVYTHGVVREALRMYTNVGTVRDGSGNGSSRSLMLRGPKGSSCEGMAFPTEGFLVWDANFAIHRDPALWARVDEALPERWLFNDADGDGESAAAAHEKAGGVEATSGDEREQLRPVKNAFRPFEMGPRNCIGQYLAITEVKLVLAMVCREFDIECAWDKWDRVHGFKGRPDTLLGDRCYEVNPAGPPKVKDGMPVHVRIRVGGEP